MSTVRGQVLLANHTTLGLGGPAERFVDAGTEEEIIAAVREADRGDNSLLILGRGSNLVIADTGFAGTVIRVASRGIAPRPAADGGVQLTVQAGEDWDPVVEWCVAEGLSGLECLSGIPGLAGATPIQNVGAYGQEVAQTLTAVRAYDRRKAVVTELASAECGFGYRTSAFRQAAGLANGTGPTGRFVVLGVTFALQRGALSAPLRYAELARTLGVGLGEQVPLRAAREAVLGLRRAKGMVLDPADPDTRSAGSFFTNPVLDVDRFAELKRVAAERSGHPVDVPHFAAGPGQVKVPAGWLIEQAGYRKGYAAGTAARISAKHTLALTNPGGASTADLVALARQIMLGVRSAFGIQLVCEPVLIGVAL